MNTSRTSNGSEPTPRRRTFALVSLAAAAAGLMLFAGTRQASAKPVPTMVTQGAGPASVGLRSLTATGTGSISAVPDRLTLNIGVQTISVRASDALSKNNVSAQSLITALKSKGVASADIKTSEVSIQPQFDTTGRRVTGYQVSNSVTVTMRKIETVGDLIEAATNSAGDSIRLGGLSFGVSDPSIPLAKARELAVKYATIQAEQLAKAAGVKLGKIRSIRSDDGINTSPMFRNVAASAQDAPPILEGSQEISASVELVFDIQD